MTIAEALQQFSLEELKQYIAAQESVPEPVKRARDLSVVYALPAELSTKDYDSVLLVRYPTEDDLVRVAEEMATTTDALLAMNVTEFMARRFISIGGSVYGLDWRLETWAKYRWPKDGDLAASWRAQDGDIEKMWAALPEQPKLRDALGTEEAMFVSTKRNVMTYRGKSFNDVMKAGIRLLTPPQYVALIIATADPKDTSTYLTFDTWEWLGAVMESCAAYGFSSSDGLSLRWGDPGSSGAGSRSRSAVSWHEGVGLGLVLDRISKK